MERYENLGVVGEGSYGVVLKCRHRETGQVVAVKKFLEGEDDPSVKKIALREVRMLKRLRHENLINLIEFFRRKRRLYLVFEYVDHTILDELEKADGGLSESTARAHIFQVLRGIAFCHHNQIIHRDIKPENVLVSRLGVIKLCDFGFARPVSNPGEAFTDYVATRWYRAPELLVGDTRYGKEVDVWAVGCLLAEMLTADPLFPGESDIDQLFHIIQAMGELSAHHQTMVEKNPMMSGLRLPSAASTPLEQTYPTWSTRSLTFIKACLHLVPNDRPSAQSLLAHDFFLHDSFPDYFLPELRHKVQQEFNGNALLSKESRRSSGGGSRKAKKGKGGLLSPEAIYGRSVSHGAPSKSDGAPRRNSMKPGIIQTSNSTRGPGLAYGMINERKGINIEDGPPSLPLASMPPLRDASNSSSNNNGHSNNSEYNSLITLSNKVSQGNAGSSNYSTKYNSNFSGSPTKASTLGLHISSLSSPSRNSERGRKSPMNHWGSSMRTRMPSNLSSVVSLPHPIDARQQRSNSTPDDDDLNLTLLLNEAAMTVGTSSHSSSNRQHHFEHQRYPYTISLDQTKELTSKPTDSLSQRDYHTLSRDHMAREHLSKDHLSRDPLKEINKDSKDSGRPLKQEHQESSGLRRSKMELANWVKSKFSNEDLSLPSVPGVVGVSLGSPLKSSRTGNSEIGVFSSPSADGIMSTASGRQKRNPGVSMPALAGTHKTSTSSIPLQQGHQLATYRSYDTSPTLTNPSSRETKDSTRKVEAETEKPLPLRSVDRHVSSLSSDTRKISLSFELDKLIEQSATRIFPQSRLPEGRSSNPSTSRFTNDMTRFRSSISAEFPLRNVHTPSSTRSSVSADSPAVRNVTIPTTRNSVSADGTPPPLIFAQKTSLPEIHGRRIDLAFQEDSKQRRESEPCKGSNRRSRRPPGTEILDSFSLSFEKES